MEMRQHKVIPSVGVLARAATAERERQTAALQAHDSAIEQERLVIAKEEKQAAAAKRELEVAVTRKLQAEAKQKADMVRILHDRTARERQVQEAASRLERQAKARQQRDLENAERVAAAKLQWEENRKRTIETAEQLERNRQAAAVQTNAPAPQEELKPQDRTFVVGAMCLVLINGVWEQATIKSCGSVFFNVILVSCGTTAAVAPSRLRPVHAK